MELNIYSHWKAWAAAFNKGGGEMNQDRDFYIMWCSLLSGDAESYFAKMPDAVLEQKYTELIAKMEQEIESERS